MPMSRDELMLVMQPFLDLELVLEIGEPIKSGKEATVFRCRAHPRAGHEEIAIKVYRPREHRSFSNDAGYREGDMLSRRAGGNTREARAVRTGSAFGREVGAHTWCGREWEVLCALHQAGLPVPAPVHAAAHAIAMELIVCEGAVAPTLSTVELDADRASWLFSAIGDDIEQMLALHIVHGDLSPYNILWNGGAYRIIDFPQTVDPRFNCLAPQLLARDLENVARFCARFTEVPDAQEIAEEMWTRFQRGEL